jgi:hypothetical protein
MNNPHGQYSIDVRIDKVPNDTTAYCSHAFPEAGFVLSLPSGLLLLN